MSSLRDRARQLLALGAYKAFVTAEYDKLRDELDTEYREMGIRGQDIKFDDGAKMGVISVGEESTVASIADEDAMLDWLAHKHPSEMMEQTLYTIRDSYRKVLLDASRAAGHGVDPEDGELLPWIRVETKAGVLRVSSSTDAKRRVRELIDRRGLLELE